MPPILDAFDAPAPAGRWVLARGAECLVRGMPGAGQAAGADRQCPSTSRLTKRWPGRAPAVRAALGRCGATLDAPAGSASYGSEFGHLGVPTQARGVLLERQGESLLLEMEAPVAKVPLVEKLYGRWVGEVGLVR